jgi:ankyrin repeat protein
MGGGASKPVKIKVGQGGASGSRGARGGGGGFVAVAPSSSGPSGSGGAGGGGGAGREERLVLEERGGEVSAAAPVELPPGWTQEVSRSTGETYYRHQDTGETQWEPPAVTEAPLPPGWEAVESADTGQTYYKCSETGDLQFDRPTAAAGVAGAQDTVAENLRGTERTAARCAAAADSLALLQSQDNLLDAAPVFMAAVEGSSEAIAAVCATDPSCVGAQHPLNGATALHVASLHGHTQCIDELLSWGADPCAGDNTAQTALHYAADQEEVLYALLSSSTARLAVNIEAEPGRAAPLLYSAYHGNIGGISCLIDYGADVDGADEEGTTALHIAALNGRRKAVKLLLQYGASLKLRDSQGRTPYEVAHLAGHEKVCKSLHHAERKAAATSGAMPTVEEAEEEEEVEDGGAAEELGDDAWLERKIEEDIIDTEHIHHSQVSTETIFQVRALYDYASGEPGDLEFVAGQVIHVSSMDEPGGGWWTGMMEAQDTAITGIFPSNFVEAASDGGNDADVAAATAKHFGMGGGTSKATTFQHEIEAVIDEKEREIVAAQTQIAEWQTRAKAAESELDRQRASINSIQGDDQGISTATEAQLQDLRRQIEQSRVSMQEERTQKAAELASLQQQLQTSRTTQVADQGLSAEAASLAQQRADELAASQQKVAKAEQKIAALELELSREREQRNSGAATAGQLQTKLDRATAELASCRAELDRLRKETTDAAKSQAAVATQLKQKQDRIDALSQAVQNAEAMAEAQSARMKNLDTQYKKEWSLRKKYYNELQDSKGNIRVYSRLRPLLKFEKERGDSIIVDIPDNQSIRVRTHAQKDLEGHGGVAYKTFSYNASFNADTSQEDVFADAKDLVQSTIDGYNVCIFAYGQTGSGKTFTMYGTEDQPGMAPRTVDEIWALIARDRTERGFEFSVKVYMAEL